MTYKIVTIIHWIKKSAMDKAEFQRRIKRLELTREEAADRLGLSLPGFEHQYYGRRPITRQTELLLGYVEKERPEIGQQLATRRRSSGEDKSASRPKTLAKLPGSRSPSPEVAKR